MQQTDEENKEMACKKVIEEIMRTILSLKQRMTRIQRGYQSCDMGIIKEY